MFPLKMNWTITQLEISLVHTGKLAEQRSSCSRFNPNSSSKIERHLMKLLTFCLEWLLKPRIGKRRKLSNNPFSLTMKLSQAIWVTIQASKRMRMKTIAKKPELFCSVTYNLNLRKLRLSQVPVNFFFMLTKRIWVILYRMMEL